MFRLLKCESCNFWRYEIKVKLYEIKCVCTIPKSYYSVLGLDSTASHKDIKSAYYKMSLQFHPDKNSGCPKSVAKFREISEAYEVLSNPEKKKRYDLGLGEGFQSPYSHNNVYNESRGGSYYRRTNFRGPFTGRTKDFNYEEHFRRHYEEEKKRQAEHEYFKRRWEAEFYQRYPNFRDYYYRQRRAESEEHINYGQFKQGWTLRRHAYFLFFVVWPFIFLLQGVSEFLNPEKLKRVEPLYYKVKNEDKDKQDKD